MGNKKRHLRGVVKAKLLNFRRTPDKDADNIIGTLHEGDSVTIYEDDGEWMSITVYQSDAVPRFSRGFIRSEFVYIIPNTDAKEIENE